MSKLTICTMLATAASSLMGCDTNSVAPVAELPDCGLGVCNAYALVEPNGVVTLTGVAYVDAFFAQVANFKATADVVADGLVSPIAKINAQLGLPAEAAKADIMAKMQAQYGIEGSITIDYAPPSCQVSAKTAVEATAKCEATVNAGAAQASCSGRCETDVQATGDQVSCSGSAKMQCTTPSASIKCQGSCKGECKVDAGLECTGSCSGGCSGGCDGFCDGKAQTGAAATNCSGKCDGKCTGGSCTGTCRMSVGGKCNGTCRGDCSVEAAAGKCDAAAKVECFAEPPTANASVQCEGKCEGTIEPPAASVECRASAKADASLKAECKPPSIDLTYKLSAVVAADVAAKAKAEFFLETFKTEMGVLVANLERSNVVLQAGAGLVSSVSGVTKSFGDAFAGVGTRGNFKTAFGLDCAVHMLPTVAQAMATASAKVATSATAATTFVANFK